MTTRARRRSWAELPVRPWLILTLAAALVTAYFLVTRINETLKDRWLIEHGVDVKVKVIAVDRDYVPKHRPRDQQVEVLIRFDWQKKPREQVIWMDPVADKLAPNAFLTASVTEMILRMDPNNPENWREGTNAKPWIHELTALIILLPVLIALSLIAVLKRGQVLRTWRDGEIAEATVVGAHHTAAAPRSRIVRYTLKQANDGGRIWSTLMPASSGIPAPGSTLWMLVARDGPGKAIVATLYHGF